MAARQRSDITRFRLGKNNRGHMFERFVKPILIIISISMFAWILFWSIAKFSKKKYGRKITHKVELILFSFYIYFISVLTLIVIPMPFNSFKYSRGGINVILVVNTVKNLTNTLPLKKE